MLISAERLPDRLQKKGLESCYFIHGDEPLQFMESVNALIKCAKESGISERLVFDIDHTSDWEQLKAEISSLSLFSTRRLIEIRLGKKRLDKMAVASLKYLFSMQNEADVLVFTSGKRDARTKNSEWWKVLEKNGVCVGVQQYAQTDLLRWLRKRAAFVEKNLTAEAASLIAARVEGNMVAASQEIEKLALILEDSLIDTEHVFAAVSDQTRYTIYQCVDAFLEGKLERGIRITRGLKEEGLEPVLLLWAFGREVRTLVVLASFERNGCSMDISAEKAGIWRSRRALLASVCRKHGYARLVSFLRETIYIDSVIKGARRGSPWGALELLGCKLGIN